MTDNLPATLTNLESLAQAHENEALALLIEAMRDPQVKMVDRIKAAGDILDRARGKAKTAPPKDPNQRRQKPVSMSVETLLKIVQGAQARVEHSDRTRREALVLEGEFVPSPRKRPINEYAQVQALVPGTTRDVEDLLS